MGKIISTIVAIVLALGGGYYVYTLCAPSFDEVTLSVDNPYAASLDRTIRYDDPAIGVDWGVDEPFLSAKDRSAPLLSASDVHFQFRR